MIVLTLDGYCLAFLQPQFFLCESEYFFNLSTHLVSDKLFVSGNTDSVRDGVLHGISIFTTGKYYPRGKLKRTKHQHLMAILAIMRYLLSCVTPPKK